MTTSAVPEQSRAQEGFFDLHITGLGYLNRVRWVQPKHGDRFLACDISALRGAKNAVDYCRFDVRVSGKKAQQLILQCKQWVDAERKVLMGFRLGDPWIDQFTYTKGEKSGQPGASLKARLLYISWIRIDGALVHKVQAQSNTSTAEILVPDQTWSDADVESEASTQAA